MSKFDLATARIVMLPIADIQPYAANPREHPKTQIAMLEASISRFGFNNPVLASPENLLIAGHGRVTAAKRLGMTSVPAIILPHLSDAEQRAFRIADNSISLKGGWSLDFLAQEISFLVGSEPDFSAPELGFELGEIDAFLSRLDPGDTEAAPPPPDTVKPAVSKVGDIWTVGKHRIACGDARDPTVYAALLRDERADVVISDMPWNLRVNGHVGGLGKIKHREFCMASGELSDADFQAFIHAVFEQQAAFSKNGALNFQFIDWRSVGTMLAIGATVYGSLINICVWVKPQPGMGSLWRSRHELVCVFKVGSAPHVNHVQLGRNGRNRSNVWEYSSPGGFGSERDNLKFHPTCKNVTMIADAIRDCTHRKGIVLDAFLGSGTTLLAADRTSRIGRGIELDPHYVDLAVRRLADETGQPPIDETGRSFSDVALDREQKSEPANG